MSIFLVMDCSPLYTAYPVRAFRTKEALRQWWNQKYIEVSGDEKIQSQREFFGQDSTVDNWAYESFISQKMCGGDITWQEIPLE